jgi:hypothetical protein
MDHTTHAILLPLLHDAFAFVDLDTEWSPKPGTPEQIAFGTKIKVPGGSVSYRLAVQTSVVEPDAFTVILLRYFDTDQPAPAGLTRYTLTRMSGSVTTTAIIDWKPVATGVTLATILSKLLVETQEASAALTLIADGFTNV